MGKDQSSISHLGHVDSLDEVLVFHLFFLVDYYEFSVEVFEEHYG